MIIQSELCHIDDTRAIVRVSAWKNEKILGSSLGEGSNSMEAEEKGLRLLLERLSRY